MMHTTSEYVLVKKWVVEANLNSLKKEDSKYFTHRESIREFGRALDRGAIIVGGRIESEVYTPEVRLSTEDKWDIKNSELYTGYCGEEDSMVRRKGKHFTVFELIGGDLEVVLPHGSEFRGITKKEKWDAYLNMIAMSEDDAKKKFHDAQDQWRYHMNHGERKDDIVLLPKGERPE